MPLLFEAEGIRLYHDDFLRFSELPPESVDLIVTSPPYDVDIQYDGFTDNIPYDKYLEFLAAALEKCYELAKPDGRLCLNIPLDKNKGGQQSVYANVVAKRIGGRYHMTIMEGYEWSACFICHRFSWRIIRAMYKEA